MKVQVSLDKSFGLAIGTAVASGWFILLPMQTAGAAGVKVMSPDEVGDAALVTRVKAQRRSEKGIPGQEEGDDSNSSSGGCSDINIGNVQAAKPGQMVPRKVVNLIEGPIVQENKCK